MKITKRDLKQIIKEQIIKEIESVGIGDIKKGRKEYEKEMASGEVSPKERGIIHQLQQTLMAAAAEPGVNIAMGQILKKAQILVDTLLQATEKPDTPNNKAATGSPGYTSGTSFETSSAG